MLFGGQEVWYIDAWQDPWIPWLQGFGPHPVFIGGILWDQTLVAANFSNCF